MARSTLRIECIDTYMSQIQDYPRITIEEEVHLADLIKNGTSDEKQFARDKLICANLRLVVKIAHDFKHFGLSFPDLVEEGNTGLMIAADKFDPSKGAKFSCYAAWWIKQSMRRALAWQTRIIRIPDTSLTHMMHLDKARNRYMQEYGHEPTVEELSSMADCPVSTIHTLQRSATETLSLDEPVSEDSETTFNDMAASTVDQTPENAARITGLHNALATLPELDQYLISATYGLRDTMKSLRLLASELGMSIKALQLRLDTDLVKLKTLMNDLMPV